MGSPAANGHVYFYTSIKLADSADDDNYLRDSFEFDMPDIDVVSSSAVSLSVFACDRFARHELLRQFTFNLQCPEQSLSVDANSNEQEPLEIKIPKAVHIPTEKVVQDHSVATILGNGTMMVSLSYLPTSGRLTVVVLNGRYTNIDSQIA